MLILCAEAHAREPPPSPRNATHTARIHAPAYATSSSGDIQCVAEEGVEACPQFIPVDIHRTRRRQHTGRGEGFLFPFLFFLYQPSSRFFTNFWCRAGHNGSNEKPAKLVPVERLAETGVRVRALSRLRDMRLAFLYRTRGREREGRNIKRVMTWHEIV